MFHQSGLCMLPAPDIALGEDQKRLLQLLRHQGAHSRIALSRLLRINNAVVTRLSRELIASGLIHEGESELSSRGRPSVPLRLRSEGAYAVGAATHPGWVDVCVVDFAGTPIAERAIPWEEGPPEQFAELVHRESADMIADLPLRRSRLLGYGVSVPGYVTINRAYRHTVARLASWRDQDLSATLGRVLEAPAWIENDANAAALAEYYEGHDPPSATLLALFLGHGVGAGCIVRGHLFHGGLGNAGEIGVLFPLSRPRPSAVDLAATLGQEDGAVDLFSLEEGRGTGDDPDVSSWIARAAVQLRGAILAGIAWMDPQAIVISGTLPARVLEPLAAMLADDRWEELGEGRPRPAIRASVLRARASARGAALLPIHHLVAPLG